MPRRTLRAAVRPLAVLALVLPLARPASAAVTCTYNSTTRIATLTFDADNQFATIRRATSGGALRLSTAAYPPPLSSFTQTCGGAQATTTDTFNVVGVAGRQHFMVDYQGGDLPGKTAENDGASEIEFNVNLGTGTDTLRVRGLNGDDVWRAGSGGVNVHANVDAETNGDIRPTNVELLVLLGGQGNDILSGAGGGGTFSPHPGPLHILGGPGNDVITGGIGIDYQEGNAGNDVMSGRDGSDVMRGGDGNDTLNGDSEADTMLGGNGIDVLNGGTGGDRFVEEAFTNGADVFNGGPGTDTVDYTGRGGAVRGDIDGVADDGGGFPAGAEGDNIKLDMENIFGGNGVNTLTGSSGPNVLVGGPANDFLFGGDGDDTLRGGLGNDELDGGEDDDMLAGQGGNDKEFGRDGNDTFYQGAAPDGMDQLFGSAGIDTLSYTDRTGVVTVTLGVGINNEGEAGEMDTAGLDVENAIGGSAGDNLNGGTVDNKLVGGGGADALNGGTAEDILCGESGVDTYTANDGFSDDLFTDTGEAPVVDAADRVMADVVCTARLTYHDEPA